MNEKPTTIQYLDTLRMLATVGLITVHVSTPVIKMAYGRNMEFWWTGNIVDSLPRFVIAIYLMLSGATMLGKDYPLMAFYKRRWMRVLVPFLFWMVAYWIFRWHMLLPREQPHEPMAILEWAGALFMKQGISKHFWYVYMILAIYLFVPFMGKAIRKLSSRTVLYILLGWTLINQAEIAGLIDVNHWPAMARKLYLYFMYSGFLVLGYYVVNLKKPSARGRVLWVLVFGLTVAVAAFSTYYLSRQAGKLDMTMYGTTTINTMLQAIALFFMVKDTNTNNPVLKSVINTTSNYSYGIYLVHIMVIDTFFRLRIFWTMAHPAISLPLVIILTFATSLGIIFILRKIPFGKYISG